MGRIEKKLSISYVEYDSLNNLPSEWYSLTMQTIDNAKNAYAPYSNFLVSAGVLLKGSRKLFGTNIENVALPIGLCAERNVLGNAISNFSNEVIEVIAIYGKFKSADKNSFISPCGMCRQAILEAEIKQKSSITILLLIENGRVLAFKSAEDLLPISFDKLK
jgi:cytidine deaminase